MANKLDLILILNLILNFDFTFLNIPEIDFIKSITFLFLSHSLESAAVQRIKKYLIKVNNYTLDNLSIICVFISLYVYFTCILYFIFIIC